MRSRGAVIRHVLIGTAFAMLFLLGLKSLVRGPQEAASVPQPPPRQAVWLAVAEPAAEAEHPQPSPRAEERTAPANAAPQPPLRLTSDSNGCPMTRPTWAEAAYTIPPPREAFG